MFVASPSLPQPPHRFHVVLVASGTRGQDDPQTPWGHQMSTRTALCADERCFWYDFGDYRSLMGHPPLMQPGTHAETAESKRRILGLVHASGLADSLLALGAEPLSDADLCLVHDPGYVRRARTLSAEGGGNLQPGAPVPAEGYDIAICAAGLAWRAVKAVLGGEADNAYALARPPGHHAGPGFGGGLCVFNNAAIAARLAMREFGLGRIAILDWDVHHGNGTEAVFREDASVMTLSIHQDEAYGPGGAVCVTPRGTVGACNINVPLPPGSGTGAYLAAMDRVMLPAIRRFAPELIIVASGVDAGASDPTGRMLLHADSFRFMTQRVLNVASEVCAGGIVMTHEGGYDPTASPYLALAILETLSGIRTPAVYPFGDLFEEGLQGHQALQPHQEAVIEHAGQLLSALG